MNIILNGKPAEVAAVRLDDLLAELGFADAVVATALNEDFVPKDRRGETEIFRASVTAVCINKDGRPIRLPAEIRALM